MSATTIPSEAYRDLSNPESYLDAKSSAIVSALGQEGIAGWVFDIPTGENVDLESDVTDHYTESGSFVTDHVVNKPIRITLTGFKGELVYTKPKKGTAQDTLNSLSTSLTAVNAYLGPLTPQATQKLAVIANVASQAAGQIEAIEKRMSNLEKYFNGEDNSPNLQTRAFVNLSAMWNSKQIVTVQTPWGFYKNMIIASISARQDDKSNDYTDFSVSFKEMRFANIKKTTFDSGAYKSAIDAQVAKTENVGKVEGTQTDASPLYTVFTPGAKFAVPPK